MDLSNFSRFSELKNEYAKIIREIEDLERSKKQTYVNIRVSDVYIEMDAKQFNKFIDPIIKNKILQSEKIKAEAEAL